MSSSLKYQKQFEEAANYYIKKFCTKQEIKFDGWSRGVAGGVAGFNNYYLINFRDIVWDVNSNQDSRLILKWLEMSKRESPENCTDYYTYTKIHDTKKEKNM